MYIKHCFDESSFVSFSYLPSYTLVEEGMSSVEEINAVRFCQMTKEKLLSANLVRRIM